VIEPHCTVVHRGHAECTCGWSSPPVFGDAGPFATWHRLAVGETIDNPYLHAFLAPVAKAEVEALGNYGSEFLAARMRRDRLTAMYAWAVPTENVVRGLATLSPICDLGCGTGYWAKLLADVGADVIAIDSCPPLGGKNHWHRQHAHLVENVVLQHFVDVQLGDAETFDVPADLTLMLCWPPYRGAMASRALARYRGDRVIYVGEGYQGCTGDDTFHEMLAEAWHPIVRYAIPQWDGLHDDVSVYVRKPA
jgi:SAM-dependent methyltransferase